MDSGFQIAENIIKEHIESQKQDEDAFDVHEHEPVFLELNALSLTEIPISILEIKNIQEIDLSKNNLEVLPDWFQRLSTIRKLDLRYNNFSILPSWIDDFKAAENKKYAAIPEDKFIEEEEKVTEDKYGRKIYPEKKNPVGLFLYGNKIRQPHKIFVSYSHKNSKEKNECMEWLESLAHSTNLEVYPWSDTEILPGEDWFKKIIDELNNSQVVLFLVSKNFFGSKFIKKHELKPVLKKFKKTGKPLAISIIIKPCKSIFEDSIIAPFQSIPSLDKPISKYRDKDEAWDLCMQKIKEAITQKK